MRTVLRRWTIRSTPICLGAALFRGERLDEEEKTGEKKTYDVSIIGGGVVGLAVAREVAVRGYSVVVFEKSDTIASGASSGNSGLGHTGYDAPRGSLERALLGRSIQRHPSLYRSFGLSYEHVRKCGSLVVAWTDEELSKLRRVLRENEDAGDEDARFVDAEELREICPGLGREAVGAVVCPREAVVEPWLVPVAYAESARLHGADIRTSTEVVSAALEDGAWTIGTCPCEYAPIGRSRPGNLLVDADRSEDEGNNRRPDAVAADRVRSRVVINCAGLFGDVIEGMRTGSLENASFECRPRKGQFVVYRVPSSDDDASSLDYIIEPVPSQFTKGVIVFRSIYGNLVVGPTATEQTSRTDRSTDLLTVSRLREFAETRVYPWLREHGEVIGTYSGLRPATEHRDYQIRAHPSQQWIVVGGIRSTGLSASAGIGEYVAELVDAVMDSLDDPANAYVPPVHAASTSIGVTEAATTGQVSIVNVGYPPRRTNDPVPPLEELAKDYRRRGDGTVCVYPGRAWRVTHPLSSFGMESIHLEDP